MKEIITTGRKYRVLADKSTKTWHRISYWTKASDVEFDDGSVLEGKAFGHAMLERSKAYEVGDIAYCASAPSWVRLKCITAGKSAAKEPKGYADINTSTTQIQDGSVTFTIEDVRLTAYSKNASDNTTPSIAALNQMESESAQALQKSQNINLSVNDEGKLVFHDQDNNQTVLDYKVHDAVYSFPSDSHGETVEVGDAETHRVRYVNATSVYTNGYSEGLNNKIGNVKKIEYTYHHHTIDGTNLDSTNKTAGPYAKTKTRDKSGGCFTKPTQHVHNSRCSSYQQENSKDYNHDIHMVDGHWECTICNTKWGDLGNGKGPEGYWPKCGTRTWTETIYTCGNKPLNAKYACACGHNDGDIIAEEITL